MLLGHSLDYGGVGISVRGRSRLKRLNQLYLVRVKKPGVPLFIIKHHGLPIRTHCDVIQVGYDVRSLAVQDNANRTKWFGMHQIFDVIGNHRWQIYFTCLARANVPGRRFSFQAPTFFSGLLSGIRCRNVGTANRGFSHRTPASRTNREAPRRRQMRREQRRSGRAKPKS
jgi:hypothetical protein